MRCSGIVIIGSGLLWLWMYQRTSWGCKAKKCWKWSISNVTQFWLAHYERNPASSRRITWARIAGLLLHWMCSVSDDKIKMLLDMSYEATIPKTRKKRYWQILVFETEKLEFVKSTYFKKEPSLMRELLFCTPYFFSFKPSRNASPTRSVTL